MSDANTQAVREVAVPNKEGLHARPVMSFVDLAKQYDSEVSVVNISRTTEQVNGKSAMHMMLLEATQGNVLRIQARGSDAEEAVEALAALVEASFNRDPARCPKECPKE